MAGENKENKTTQLSANPGSSNQIGEQKWVEVHLYSAGRGPIAIIRSALVGSGLDRIDVRSILSKHVLRSLFAFRPPSERGFRIRFDLVNGQSVHHYKPGSVVYFDSEPKVNLDVVSQKLLCICSYFSSVWIDANLHLYRDVKFAREVCLKKSKKICNRT
jgi:hypothetical protein